MSAPPRFTFDPAAMRYRNAASGKFVSSQQVHGYVLDYSTNLGKSLRGLTEQLRSGSLDLRSWQLQMAQEIKAGHLAAGMAAKGGRAQMTQSDYGRIGQILRGEYRYLQNFADQIASGQIPLDGRVLARAEQYGLAAHDTYETVYQREAQRRGADESRSVRGKTDSCEASGDRPGCIEEAARGWVKIGPGGLSNPGSRTCLSRCGCHLIHRNSATGQEFD